MLRERTVQIKALDELRRFYSQRENNENLYSSIEVRTRKEKGNKRADGIICFETKDKQIYTVSLEAKSHKTLGQLTSWTSDDKIGVQSIIFSAIITLLAVALLFFFIKLVWYFIILAGVAMLLASFLFTFWLLDKLDLDDHKIISVIEQLKQYPANAQWIAYSTYTDNLLANIPSNYKKNHLQLLGRVDIRL